MENNTDIACVRFLVHECRRRLQTNPTAEPPLYHPNFRHSLSYVFLLSRIASPFQLTAWEPSRHQELTSLHKRYEARSQQKLVQLHLPKQRQHRHAGWFVLFDSNCRQNSAIWSSRLLSFICFDAEVLILVAEIGSAQASIAPKKGFLGAIRCTGFLICDRRLLFDYFWRR